MSRRLNPLHVVPRPQSVNIGEGELEFPDNVRIAISPGGKQMRFAAGILSKSLRAQGIRSSVITSERKGNGFYLAVATASQSIELKEAPASLGDEGYALDISDHIEVRANSAKGIFYGVQSLVQALTAGSGKLQRCEILDKPSIPLRGIMADLARLKEKDEYYFKLIDFMSQYKFNTIFLHLSDDQGAPIELKKHPKLTSDYAMTQDTIRKLIKYAADRHIEVIPEMEVWGHAGWIVNHEEYADLAEDGAADLCTTNPKTWLLVADIFDEICELFPSRYIHGGSDEANFGKCPVCKAEVEDRGAASLVGEHVKRTAEIIHERGRTPMIWADVLLNYPGSEDIVPKYAILNHWDYAANPLEEPVKYLRSKGFTVMLGSGIVFGSRAVLPKGDALRNVENFGIMARKFKLPGINNTIWIPQRYVSDTLWYGIALAGEASWSEGKPDRNKFTTAFFKTFFGIDATPELCEAVTTLHEIPAYVGDNVIGMWRNRKEFNEMTPPETHAQKEGFLISMTDTLKTLRTYKSQVTRNKWEYSSLIYAAHMKLHIAERSSAPGRIEYAIDEAKRLSEEGNWASASRRMGHQARKLVQLATREARLADETEKYWDKWRYADDPKKANPFQNTLSAFRTSDGYMRKVAGAMENAARELAMEVVPDWDAMLAE